MQEADFTVYYEVRRELANKARGKYRHEFTLLTHPDMTPALMQDAIKARLERLIGFTPETLILRTGSWLTGGEVNAIV
jgi:hypothetical protein